MNFYKVNEGGARRDDGVSVQIVHADYLEYREGDLMVQVSLGYNPSTRQIHVYAADITNWSAPSNSIPISIAKRLEIITNLGEALSLLKGRYVIS